MPKRSRLNDPHGKQTPGGIFGGKQWVIDRGECQYRCEDLSALPANKRLQAAKLAVVRHRPSPAAHAHTVWVEGVAHLWFWLPEAPVSAEVQQHWLPESLLHAPPATDGVRLLALADGYEAQFWKRGGLADSQWWPQPPTDDAWQRFVRGTGLDASAHPQPPAATQQAWLLQPWGERPLAERLAGMFSEKTCWQALLVLVALALGWQLAGWWRWQHASEQVNARLETTRSAIAPLLDAREHAEQALFTIQSLQTLQPQNADYLLMAELAQRLPKDSQFSTWRREGNKLQVNIRSTETDPRLFVEAFNNHPRLAEVAVTPLLEGGMQLVFDLPDAASVQAAENAAANEEVPNE